MKSNLKVSGIATAAAALIATGAVVGGHQVDVHSRVALADKSCHSKKGCEKKEGKKDAEKKEALGSL